MGTTSSKPTNKVGGKVVKQKLESASKTGVLSLREHKLENIPPQVFSLTNVRTLDVSLNKLQTLPVQLSASLVNLKSFKCDENQLSADSLNVISQLSKLQNLSMKGNKLGQLPSEVPKKSKQSSKSPAKPMMTISIDDCSNIPKSLKQVNMSHNMLSKVPSCLYNVGMKLEKLDLSFNRIISIPAEIFHLKGTLTEINLDNNTLVSLPLEIGMLTKLKTLSLKNNHISKNKNKRDPQPLPSTIFTDTPLIDLNLHGNPMTNTELNEFEGFPSFLERRQKIKSKNIYGGALTDLAVCGLE